jgi:transposase-like protein
MTISIQRLIDDSKCYEMVRELRWADGVKCPHCASENVVKIGHDTTQRFRQRYRCSSCERCFDDLTGTLFAGHHQPLRVWMLCSYLMGLNLSNLQIAIELSLSASQAQEMTTQLRQGIADRQEPVVLDGEVECDEVYVVAGHKGNPEAVKKKGEKADDDD